MYCCGLDVSRRTTAVCVVDGDGRIVKGGGGRLRPGGDRRVASRPRPPAREDFPGGGGDRRLAAGRAARARVNEHAGNRKQRWSEQGVEFVFERQSEADGFCGFLEGLGSASGRSLAQPCSRHQGSAVEPSA